LPPPRGDFAGREWVAALKAIERGPHQRDRKERWNDGPRQRGDAAVSGAQMFARESPQVGKCRLEAGGRLPGKYVLLGDLVPFKDFDRHVKLTPR
jgi:hypothetical protein